MMDATTPEPGKASDYTHPLSMQELLRDLSYGMACQMPTRMAEKVGRVLDGMTETADVRVRIVEIAGARRLQIIPIKVALNHWGTKLVEGKLGDERTLFDGKLMPPREI